MNNDNMTFDEKWNSLTITDDFIFGRVFSDREKCRKLIELLLGIRVRSLEIPQAQKSVKTSILSRGVRFDVYAEDEERVFDIEIQTVNRHNWELRTRYYQSKMDSNLISQGQDFRDLKETYVIFLCCFDPIGFTDCRYETVHVLKNHTDYVVDDKRHILLYNINEYLKSDDKELRDFLEYMATGRAASDFSREVQDVVDRAKTDDVLRSGYMTLEMEIKSRCRDAMDAGRREGIEQGRNEGIAEGETLGAEKTRLENAVKMKEKGFSMADIADITGLTLEQVQAL